MLLELQGFVPARGYVLAGADNEVWVQTWGSIDASARMLPSLRD
ncbi:hypothetical protein [Streptomyces sp. XY006]|nr:hypothetical protein [Streptomyces sp. XY006]